jgi:hypothetical protein
LRITDRFDFDFTEVISEFVNVLFQVLRVSLYICNNIDVVESKFSNKHGQHSGLIVIVLLVLFALTIGFVLFKLFESPIFSVSKFPDLCKTSRINLFVTSDDDECVVVSF